MKFQGFVGPSYNLKSVNVDCQRCVNLFPEVIESGTGKEGSVSYLRTTPGLEKILNVGTGANRLVYVDHTGNILVINGNKAYLITYTASVWAATLLSTGADSELDTTAGPIKAATVVVANKPVTVLVDGVMDYIWDPQNGFLAGSTFARFDAALGYVMLSSHVTFLDGYLLYNKLLTGQFYASNISSPLAVSPLSFASTEGDPDNIVGLIAVNRELWIFNERSTEVFVNTGNADFPFERAQGGFLEVGCLAPHSIAKIDRNVFWLAKTEQGQGAVYAGSGLTPQRISTHAIEQAISSYADLKSATAYTYSHEGHSFYVLNFNEATWVFDLSTKLWHERGYTNAGVLERHRVGTLAFYPALGVHLATDYSNNKLYILKHDHFYDDADAITRIRTFPHVSSGLKRLFCKSLQLDMEVGVGLDGGGVGSNPQMMLDFSDDGGHTWSSESWASIGKTVGGIGEFKTRVIWRRLGSFRDRVFRIKITDPVKVNLISAEIDLASGVS